MRLSILVVIIILFKDSSTIKEFDLINIDYMLLFNHVAAKDICIHTLTYFLSISKSD